MNYFKSLGKRLKTRVNERLNPKFLHHHGKHTVVERGQQCRYRTLTISRTQISSRVGAVLHSWGVDARVSRAFGGLTGHRKLTLRLNLPLRLLPLLSSASTVWWSLLREHAPPMIFAAWLLLQLVCSLPPICFHLHTPTPLHKFRHLTRSEQQNSAKILIRIPSSITPCMDEFPKNKVRSATGLSADDSNNEKRDSGGHHTAYSTQFNTTNSGQHRIPII